jgi:hypothetical protein
VAARDQPHALVRSPRARRPRTVHEPMGKGSCSASRAAPDVQSLHAPVRCVPTRGEVVGVTCAACVPSLSCASGSPEWPRRRRREAPPRLPSRGGSSAIGVPGCRGGIQGRRAVTWAEYGTRGTRTARSRSAWGGVRATLGTAIAQPEAPPERALAAGGVGERSRYGVSCNNEYALKARMLTSILEMTVIPRQSQPW